MGRLDNRVVIVTGGAQGIGKAYCEGLAGEGAKVVVADINTALSDGLVRSLTDAGHDAMAVTADVSNVEQADNMAKATIDRYGRIDGLINNAAVFQRPAMSRVPFDQVSVEEWDRLMAVNLRGTFLCARSVVPHMKEQGEGSIINISSGTVHFGAANVAHYVASKAGVIGFTRVLARELGPFNIRCNAIAPGLTISVDDPDEARLEGDRQRMQARSIKRTELPTDLVGTAIFLCSSDSAFMTGQTLAVDGGATMR
jgi:3-oxoacyl-[acyl-carrier protein] reductase